MPGSTHVTTGFPSLDGILDGLRIGDNVVWSVDSIEDYREFVRPFVREALTEGRRVVYLRFGRHEPLLDAGDGVVIVELDPRRGFDDFATRIHMLVASEGKGVFYVFDSLSDLLSAWATDLMIGNFFWVTCPFLYELETVAYFALIRDRHSLKTIERIRDTTQVLIALYREEESVYLHPLKVWQRHSPTMFLPHLRQEGGFLPLADSYQATRLLSRVSSRTSDPARRQLDHWHHLFIEAEELVRSDAPPEEQQKMIKHLCRHMIGREERMLELARNHFTLKDLLQIKSRLIGTGFIGGKAVGMLLARDILLRDPSFDWETWLEPHDSFFIGSNVYYSYLVYNGWWPLFAKQKTDEGYYHAAAELKEKMFGGAFPEQIRQGLHDVLEYYGQYPIIVRSSSLLEDGFGNAFAGKYDSFFLANQGTPEERYAALEEAVRAVYASTMSEDALAYRRQRGLAHLDEQMGLLIQRVSGAYRRQYYFPELAGVGVSFNTFVWDREMDPKAGMLRLVYGLGTRAVDRVEGDYPRLVALDAPLRKPHSAFSDTRRFSQRDVDLLDVDENILRTVSLSGLLTEIPDLSIQRFAVVDHEAKRLLRERGRPAQENWILTFDDFLSESSFAPVMQRLLKTLEAAYDYPVDVEFTVNFTSESEPLINIVQCRPLQTKGQKVRIEIPEMVAEEDIFIRMEGNFMGGNIAQPIHRIIWIEPEAYIRLPMTEKYEVARLVGRLNKRLGDRHTNPTLLMGPGRWGTSTPSLGVPIHFAEISNMAALAEVAFPRGELMPELSFGSHFFQDLVETDIFYLALFPEHPGVVFDRAWLDALPNALEGMMPASARFKTVVKVCEIPSAGLQVMADVVSQKLLSYRSAPSVDKRTKNDTIAVSDE
jgi:hypothetical protein